MKTHKPKVLILMSTYNGENFLFQQLESIQCQKDVEIEILVRDDGSKDNTLNILKDFNDKFNILRIYKEDNIGSARSFMRLISIACSLNKVYDFYAFSDQDDIWLPTKIIRAINCLSSMKKELSLIYCGSPKLVDEKLNPMPSKEINLNGTFGESMIINRALGCTEVFNENLLRLINRYEPKFLMMHDAWVYRVCLATGGHIYYDKQKYILYRQHSQNVVGGRSNIYLRWKRRINAYLSNYKNVRLKTAENLFYGYESYLTSENKEILYLILNYRRSFKDKIALISNKALKTNSKEHNIIFKIAVIMGIY
ncbi:MAG: glycosyltransferase [bacterium]